MFDLQNLILLIIVALIANYVPFPKSLRPVAKYFGVLLLLIAGFLFVYMFGLYAYKIILATDKPLFMYLIAVLVSIVILLVSFGSFFLSYRIWKIKINDDGVTEKD